MGLVEAVEIPEEVSADIRGMLRAYQEHRQNMLSDVEIRNKRNQVAGFMGQLELVQSELAALELPYLEKMADLEMGVQHLGLETISQSFIHAGVVVRFRKGDPDKVSWKPTVLNPLLAALEEEGEYAFAERMIEARNPTPRAPSIKIEE